ncbi:hypothetical protein HPB51_008430 [Rhipicephalus microplus]|uniref:Tick transposon n=1 Tax=Rhipicephalus microplus TaxID=6941 RepID=A0A9J6EG81_RHIMP|nr:hypothetical protein HPB51_008430 [Rhipicephalus microplus]
MIKRAKGKKLSALERYHRSGSEIAGCAKLNEDGMWTVPSQSTKGHSYTVTKVMDDACWPLRCKECAVCVHTYRLRRQRHLRRRPLLHLVGQMRMKLKQTALSTTLFVL